jgi:hypothetical protein
MISSIALHVEHSTDAADKDSSLHGNSLLFGQNVTRTAEQHWAAAAKTGPHQSPKCKESSANPRFAQSQDCQSVAPARKADSLAVSCQVKTDVTVYGVDSISFSMEGPKFGLKCSCS